jgi:hypothetical protein
LRSSMRLMHCTIKKVVLKAGAKKATYESEEGG